MNRIILHSDMNNFYANVECLYNPSLRNKPIAVAGDPKIRHGIVLAKNDLAKQYGVQTGEPLWMAEQKCKEIVFVPPHYERYFLFSRMAQEIYSRYTDQVEPFGLDECWLDVSGSIGLFGSGKTIADKIRRQIKDELGITASIGVSYNKIFAKLGSDMRKPDATTVIAPNNIREKIWPLPAGDLLFVGQATRRKLSRYYINTIGDLARTDPQLLVRLLGINGDKLWRFANGMDISPVSQYGTKTWIKSIGNSTTTPRDLESEEEVKIILYALCEKVSARLRKHCLSCETVQLSVRDQNFIFYERQGKFDYPSCATDSIFNLALKLYRQNFSKVLIRSLGVRACRLAIQEQEQLSLLSEVPKMQKREQLDKTIDWLRSRYGYFAIQRGVMLMDKSLAYLSQQSPSPIYPGSFFKQGS